MRICSLFISIFLFSSTLFGQDSSGFNYQAVVRDANSNVVSNQQVGIRLSILHGAADGPVIYSEEFVALTNSYGLLNIEVGSGSPTTGVFETINWSEGPYFMETAMDISGGTNYSVMGVTQLRSVPFALYAEKAESVAEKSYSVGDRALGGIVFYVNEEGTHGLIAEVDDHQSEVTWYEARDNLNNPAYLSEDGEKFFDWRLPTKFELNLLFPVKNIIGNFTRDHYWSANEGSVSKAWSEDFASGRLDTLDKTDKASVRLIRAF